MATRYLHHHLHLQQLRLYLFITIFVVDIISISYAQQSAAGQDTLIGIVGRDFIIMGADSSSSGGGGIALTSSNIDKLTVIHDGKGFVYDDDNTSNSYNSRQSMKQQAVAVGFAGDTADADRLMGMLKVHAQVEEYEAGIGNDVECVFDGSSKGAETPTAYKSTILGSVSPAGLDAEAISNLARQTIASRMRSRQPLQLCLLVGGMVRCSKNNIDSSKVDAVNRIQTQISVVSTSYRSKSMGVESAIHDGEQKPIVRGSDSKNNVDDEYATTANPFLTPKLFWLDQYGSLQNMRYAAHGYGSNFAYSILDQRYRYAMSRQEAVNLIQKCFEQLRQRYVINSPQPPRIKCIDKFGVTEIIGDSNMKH